MIESSLLLLLVAFFPVSAGRCRCLSQNQCDKPGGCQFKCQPGYAGENCQYDNLGYKARARGRKLLDGNYNTCISIRTLKIRRFNTPRSINTVRIHRRKGRRAGGNVYLYVEKKQIKTWHLPGFEKNPYGDILTLKFPVVDGATSATIGSVRSACEIEFTNEGDTERAECTEDSCSGKGRCSIVDGKPVCACEAGFNGKRCDIGCQSGFYGINCSSNCSAGCSDSCDSVDGSCDCKPGFAGDKCDNPCQSGTYGINCSSNCSAGCSDSCDFIDGSCDCKPGFAGDKCDNPCQSGTYGINCSSNCSAGCSDSCDFIDGSCDCKPGFAGDKCDNPCQSGTYGINCSSNCSAGCSDSCDFIDGSCDCKPGFAGDKCDNPCQSGTYGINCSSNCSAGCSDSCDFIDGSCDCKPGFAGDKCDNPCQSGSYGINCSSNCSAGCSDSCDFIDGSCDCKLGFAGDKCDNPCQSGSYGINCSSNCSAGCSDSCDPVDGSCVCKPGFIGDKCDNPCQSGTYGINCSSNCSMGCSDSCDPVDGSCVCKPGFIGDKCDNPCQSGTYGINCSSNCSMRCSDSCDSVDGSCDCKPGFAGDKCDNPCLSGTYGINCSSNCSAGCSDSCDSVNGSCDCKPGLMGDKCDNPCQSGTCGINCSSNCSMRCSDSCDSVNGSCDCKPGFAGDKCDSPCSSGSYGINCSIDCSTGCSDSCDSVDGSCDCKPGFTGDKCENPCQKGYYGHGCNKTCRPQCLMCDHVTGSCKSKCTSGWYGEICDRGCPLGFYGPGCAQICREGCQSELCDAVQGTCTPPCNSGWRGDNCSRRCDSNRYGEDCALNCSEGCVHSSCDPESGECEECRPGWQHGNLSRRCDKRCSEGFYGKGCLLTCSEGCRFGMCSSLDGTCGPPCKEDWTGSSCLIKIIYCPAAEYNTTVGVFNIPRTPVGRTFSTPELCLVDGRPMGEVNCSADGQGGGNWSSLITNRACDYSDLDDSDISDTLTSLLKGKKDLEEVIHTTVNISRNMTLNKRDVLLVTDIMERTRNLSEVSTQFAEGVLTMYDKIIEVPESTLIDLQERSASSNRILRSVDDITGKIQPGPTGTERVSTETFVCQVWDLNNPSVTSNNLHFGLVLSASYSNQNSSVDPTNNKSVEYAQTYEAVMLPQSLLVNLQNGSEGKDIRMSMNIYKDPLLFTKASTTEATFLLSSKVVAAKIVVDGKEITNLGADSVTMIFSQPKVDKDAVKRCGYWNFSLSGWSTDGCEFSQSESGLGECTCDHLTNFAILLDLEGNADRNSVHSLPLSVITTLGLSLSILGLSGTLLSFIVFKRLRKKHPQQTLFNLALAELCAWLVFLAGITQTQSHAGCTLVAILLHYFLLASFMWMLAEAFLHYLLLVKVQAQGAFTNRYMLKTGLPAWGFPLLPVLIVLAVDPGLYRGSDSHCWMSLSASLYAFALPVGIIILFNIIIYIKVVINIFRMSKAQAGATKGNKKRELLKIRVPFLCFILFGLSWIFGFLAVSEAKVVFQYLFCLTSSTQGFLIFIFFTARNEEVRQLWRELCRMKKRHLMSVGKKEISTSIMTTKTTGDIETSV